MCRRNWRLKWNNRRSRCCLHTLIFVGPLEKLFLIKLPTPGGVGWGGLIFCYYFSRHFPDFWNPNPARTPTPPPRGGMSKNTCRLRISSLGNNMAPWTESFAGGRVELENTFCAFHGSHFFQQSSSNSSWLPQNSVFQVLGGLFQVLGGQTAG